MIHRFDFCYKQNYSMNPNCKILVFLLLFLLTSCYQSTQISEPVEDVSPVQSPALTATLEPLPYPTIQPDDEIGSYWLETVNGDEKIFPNHWTAINPNKIQSYSYTSPIGSALGQDGSTWFLGSFGVIWQKPDGSQVRFSDEFPNLYGFPSIHEFAFITIGPDEQVWVGGWNKTLFRFDGTDWLDEGKNIPEGGGNPELSCYSKHIVGIDFDESGSPWIMTREIEIYYLQNGQWTNFEHQVSDYLMDNAGGGGCPLGIKIDSTNNIMIRMAGCCGRETGSGLYFDGNVWEVTDEPDDIQIIFRWLGYKEGVQHYVIKNSHDFLRVAIAIYETDGTIRIMSFLSWLYPRLATYSFERPDSIIYITNQVATPDEPLIARFDKDTQTWRSFLFKNFEKEKFVSAQVDEDGYIWLDFRGSYSSELLMWQDGLYRLSPDVFDDYESPNIP